MKQKTLFNDVGLERVFALDLPGKQPLFYYQTYGQLYVHNSGDAELLFAEWLPVSTEMLHRLNSAGLSVVLLDVRLIVFGKSMFRTASSCQARSAADTLVCAALED